MNLIDLYRQQAELDQFIFKRNDLTMNGEIKKKSYLALKVEFGEFINDIQSFKYWKRNNKPKSSALEEGIDVLHFLLQVGLMNGWDKLVTSVEPNQSETDLTDLQIMFEYNRFESASDFINGVSVLLQMLNLLGYTENDILTAYQEKNLINYQRQQEGY